MRKANRGYNWQDQWDLYDKEHGYTPETRPKCPVCGNELKFNGYNNGYQTACSLSCAAKLTQKRLKEHKFDKQLQYDKEHGYTPETRPKCKQCGAEARFSNSLVMYLDVCNHCLVQNRKKTKLAERQNAEPQTFNVQQQINFESRILSTDICYDDNNIQICKVCGKPDKDG